MIVDVYGLHVLASNIQDKGYITFKGPGRAIMGYGLNHTIIKAEGRFDKIFTIPSSRRSDDARQPAGLFESGLEFNETFFHCLQGIAVIGHVMAKYKFTFIIH